jgi:hypothetical protein
MLNTVFIFSCLRTGATYFIAVDDIAKVRGVIDLHSMNTYLGGSAVRA